jgi:hypothetical protein
MAQYCYYNGNTQIKKVNFNGNTYRRISVSLSNMTKLFILSSWYSGTCKNGLVYQRTYSESQSKIAESYTYTYKIYSLTMKSPNKSYTQTVSCDADPKLTNWHTLPNYSASTTFGAATAQTRESYTACARYYGMMPGMTVTVPAQYQWKSYLKASEPKYIVSFSYSASNVANDAAFAPNNFANWYNVANNGANYVNAQPSQHYTVSRQVFGHLLWNYISTYIY